MFSEFCAARTIGDTDTLRGRHYHDTAGTRRHYPFPIGQDAAESGKKMQARSGAPMNSGVRPAQGRRWCDKSVSRREAEALDGERRTASRTPMGRLVRHRASGAAARIQSFAECHSGPRDIV